MLGMTAGWVCRVMSEAAEIEVEQLDDAGKDWFAVGPGGEHMGGLTETVAAAFGESTDPAWLAVVVDTIERDCGSDHRSMLLVKRASGTWFHTTLAENRESISDHGLDWRRMTGSGIAGSPRPEADGVFLCVDIEGAEWFAEMGRRRGCAVDIWAVALDGTLLIGDPSASGGGDDCWMICPEPIPNWQLKLVRQAPLAPRG
jgi:hypothetical protein